MRDGHDMRGGKPTMSGTTGGDTGTNRPNKGARSRADRVISRRRAAALPAVAAVLTLALALAGCDSGSGPADGSRLPESRTSTPTATPPPPETATSSPAAGRGTIPARLEADGTTVTVGDPAAPHTLTVVEDPRCPYCEQFEQANAARIQQLEKAGTIRVQYTFASFLDQSLGGGGSKRAVNALRAALGADGNGSGFVTLHTLVYEYQPNENSDGFTADFLLELAGKVPGLRTPAFDAAVRGQTYASFVTASENAFTKSGASGTPVVKIDGDNVSGQDGVSTAAGFDKLLAGHGVS